MHYKIKTVWKKFVQYENISNMEPHDVRAIYLSMKFWRQIFRMSTITRNLFYGASNKTALR